ncbi:MAG: serine hydrolase [Lachnospiraceae bacterium]|nr:serine hydrolase [Lachnospiraceae bacterium]
MSLVPLRATSSESVPAMELSICTKAKQRISVSQSPNLMQHGKVMKRRLRKSNTIIMFVIVTCTVLYMAISIPMAPVTAESDILSAGTTSPDNEKAGLKGLKKKINKELKGKKGKWSVYIKNLDTNEYLLINDKKLPSASHIKLFVMMKVYDEINNGDLKESSSVKTRLKNMITVSDNNSANELTALLTKKKTFRAGAKRLNKYCKKEGYTKTKFIVEMGMSSLKNVTSAKDCGRVLERIYRKTAVNKKSSGKMLKLLKAQKRRTKIPAGVPAKVTVANKTGETYFAENDAAIVFSDGADYVIVVMSKNGQGAVSEIRKISKIAYKYFNTP